MTTILTILACLVVVLCLGIAAATTHRSVKLSRRFAAVSERLDVLENLMAPRNGTRAEAKLILSRNYLKGLRVWAQL